MEKVLTNETPFRIPDLIYIIVGILFWLITISSSTSSPSFYIFRVTVSTFFLVLLIRLIVKRK
jgi:hypothetical protein